ARVHSGRPAADLDLRVDTGCRFDIDARTLALSSPRVSVTGHAPGGRRIETSAESDRVDVDLQSGSVSVSRLALKAKSSDGLEAAVATARLSLAADRLVARTLSATLTLRNPPRTLTARLHVPEIAMEGPRIGMPRLDLDFAAAQAGGSVQGRLAT